jgi:hypothetical protein
VCENLERNRDPGSGVEARRATPKSADAKPTAQPVKRMGDAEAIRRLNPFPRTLSALRGNALALAAATAVAEAQHVRIEHYGGTGKKGWYLEFDKSSGPFAVLGFIDDFSGSGNLVRASGGKFRHLVSFQDTPSRQHLRKSGVTDAEFEAHVRELVGEWDEPSTAASAAPGLDTDGPGPGQDVQTAHTGIRAESRASQVQNDVSFPRGAELRVASDAVGAIAGQEFREGGLCATSEDFETLTQIGYAMNIFGRALEFLSQGDRLGADSCVRVILQADGCEFRVSDNPAFAQINQLQRAAWAGFTEGAEELKVFLSYGGEEHLAAARRLLTDGANAYGSMLPAIDRARRRGNR